MQALVHVDALDQFTAVGTRALLRSCPSFELLPDDRRHEANVRVAVRGSADISAIADLGDARCVLVAGRVDDGLLLSLVQRGVAVVLRREEATGDRLVDAVETAFRGGADLPPRLQGQVLAELQRLNLDVLRPRGLTQTGLSERERDVLSLLASGLDTEEIAERLHCASRTVKYVLTEMRTRLGLTNRVHAVAYGLRVGAI